jgi:hypothetical protein
MNLLIKVSGFFYEYTNKNSLILIPLLVAALTIYFFGILVSIISAIILLSSFLLLRIYVTHPSIGSSINTDYEIYYFHSPRCAGCLFSDVINNISNKDLYNNLNVIDVTKNNNRSFIKKFNIKSVPTWICTDTEEKIFYRSNKPPINISKI